MHVYMYIHTCTQVPSKLLMPPTLTKPCTAPNHPVPLSIRGLKTWAPPHCPYPVGTQCPSIFGETGLKKEEGLSWLDIHFALAPCQDHLDKYNVGLEK